MFTTPVPDLQDFGIQGDATAYFGSIPINATLGTEIFRFRIIVNLSRVQNDLDLIAVVLTRNYLVETVFGFKGGQNYRVIDIAAQGGIDAENVSRLFPEITVIDNRLVVYEDYVIYQQLPPPFIELPVILDFDLYFVAVGRNFTVYQEFAPLPVGRVTITLPPGITIKRLWLEIFK
jgi:hypothetical protein